MVYKVSFTQKNNCNAFIQFTLIRFSAIVFKKYYTILKEHAINFWKKILYLSKDKIGHFYNAIANYDVCLNKRSFASYFERNCLCKNIRYIVLFRTSLPTTLVFSGFLCNNKKNKNTF